MEETTTDKLEQSPGAQEAQPEQPEQPSAVEQPASQEQNNEPTEEQAPQEDNLSWLEKKGIDPTSPEALAKVAEMYRNAEKAMHQSTTKASELEKALTTGEAIQPDYSGIPTEVLEHPFVQTLVDRLDRVEQTTSTLTLEQQIGSFFATNPEAKALEAKMASIVTDRPEIGQLVRSGYLNLKDVYSMAATESGAIETAKAEGGREALQQVASKQQARAVVGTATSPEVSPATSDDDFLKGFNRGTAL